MSYRTIAAAFDSHDHANAAIDALKADGFRDGDISLLEKSALDGPGAWSGKNPTHWQRLVGEEVLQQDASIYLGVLERGGAVVAVRVPAHEVAHATAVLDRHNPVGVGNHGTPGVVTPLEFTRRHTNGLLGGS